MRTPIDQNRHPPTQPKAIVLGLGHPRSYATIRSLAKAGVPVVAVHHQHRVHAHSRYLAAALRFSANPDEQLVFLERLGEEEGALLFPTNDEYLVLVSKNIARLSRRFILSTPPWEILRHLMEKTRCYKIAQEAGVRTPTFYRPRDSGELNEIVRRLDLRECQYILKTDVTTVPADARTRRFSKAAGSDAASIAVNCLEIFSRLGEFPIIEEVVPGRADRCIGVHMVVDRNHEPLMTFCVRRLKLSTYSTGGQFIHPYDAGANVYCESVHDDEAAEAARRFVRRAEYYGPITVEFRRDPRNETLTFIKADPRVVRATGLSTALGLDIPTAVYRLFTGQAVRVPNSYPDGVAWLWPTAYLTTLWRNRSNRSLLRELATLLRSFRRIKAFAQGDIRDPMPLVAAAGRMVGRRLARRMIRRRASRYPTPGQPEIPQG
ncbi:MAG: hypothetical protein HY713_04650 [candidate division NC10 bacterium]|nr:hypothetical protein [candidate division NC10 bacterium]